LKKGHPLVPDTDLQLVFKRLSEGAVEGLRSLGVDAEFQQLTIFRSRGRRSLVLLEASDGTVFIMVASCGFRLGDLDGPDVPQVKLADRHVVSVQKEIRRRRRAGKECDDEGCKEGIVRGIETLTEYDWRNEH